MKINDMLNGRLRMYAPETDIGSEQVVDDPPADDDIPADTTGSEPPADDDDEPSLSEMLAQAAREGARQALAGVTPPKGDDPPDDGDLSLEDAVVAKVMKGLEAKEAEREQKQILKDAPRNRRALESDLKDLLENIPEGDRAAVQKEMKATLGRATAQELSGAVEDPKVLEDAVAMVYGKMVTGKKTHKPSSTTIKATDTSEGGNRPALNADETRRLNAIKTAMSRESKEVQQKAIENFYQRRSGNA